MKHTILMVLVMGLLSIGLAGCGNDTATAPVAKGEAPAVSGAGTDAPAAAQAASPGTPGPAGAGESSGTAEDAGREPSTAADAGALTPESLIHHRFMLSGIDGAPFTPGERVPELEFNEGFRIAAGICNRFTGQAELDGGVLKAGRMASTKMLCIDETLNALENRFAAMMEAGAQADFDGRTLTLTRDGESLTWTLRDRVQ